MVGSFIVTGVTPVKLADFAVTALNQEVRLSWKTLNEENADYFSVQQSFNGIDFEEAGTVKAAGYSTTDKSYFFTIANIPGNRRFIYFRLVTTDHDKKQQYSNIILYRNPGASEGFIHKVYPNPVMKGGHLFINFESDKVDKITVSIFDATGKTLTTIPLSAREGVNQTHLPLPEMTRGNYYLRFTGDGKRAAYPLIVR